MRVFVTGATGYIGSVVTEHLISAGHRVIGLARNDDAVAKLEALGAESRRGDYAHPAGLAEIARDADGVIGLASARDGAVNSAAARAILGALENTKKPYVFTSGTWVHGDSGGTALDENTPLRPAPLVTWVVPVEEEVLAAAENHVRTVVIRPAMVYGRGGGSLADFVHSARKRGAVRYIGTGENRWPMVHVDDLADLYVRALEGAPAGSVWIASHGPAYRVRELAEAASRGAGTEGRTLVWPLDEARAKLGDFAEALTLDQLASGKRAKDALGWKPNGPDPIEELERGSYVTALA